MDGKSGGVYEGEYKGNKKDGKGCVYALKCLGRMCRQQQLGPRALVCSLCSGSFLGEGHRWRRNHILALSAPGNVLVVDQGNSRIVLFSAAGEVVRTIGEGQLRDPYGDDDPFIVLTETKFSFRCIPVWIGTLLTGLGSKKRTHVIMFSP